MIKRNEFVVKIFLSLYYLLYYINFIITIKEVQKLV